MSVSTEINRRQFLRSVGGVLLGVSAADVFYNAKKAHEQIDEAKIT
jgi:hypothetical protein